MPLNFASQSPQVALWQMRLRRVPPLAWVLILLIVVVPLAVLLAGVAVVAIVGGLTFALLAIAITRLRIGLRRLTAGREQRLTANRANAGRKNVRIVVERIDQRFV
jgi:membrane associated rhomboid family serine protease